MTCPICGYKKRMSVDKLYYQSFGCPQCSDGLSYPEKFFLNILQQLNIKFKFQLNKKDFVWCDKYRYDFYLPDYNCIIETNGIQHYEDGWKKINLQRKIDKQKRELALKNRIKYYIELDCRYSDKDYIKHSLINSNVPFEINDIDYNEADLKAQRNILIDACELYESHPEITIKQIALKYNVHVGTIVRYLKKGREIGLCKYRDERKSNRSVK